MRKSYIYFIYLVSVALAMIWAAVSTSFLLHRTSYFTLLALPDPSLQFGVRAAWYCGLTISLSLTLTLLYGILLFHRSVIKNFPAYETANRIWQAESGKLLSGQVTPLKLLEHLTDSVPKGTRIHKALLSWQDASPKSDPEMVIEGAAAGDRSRISHINAMASVLVLIGLIGNFFGLSQAVTELSNFSSSPVSTTAVVETVPSQSAVAGAPGVTLAKTIETRRSNIATPEQGTAGTAGNSGDLSKISQGISVVVVSSILGILGMAILLFYASQLRAELNTLVSMEVTLVAAEIAPALAPDPNREALKNIANMSGAMSQLPKDLAGFQSSAAQLADSIRLSYEGIKTTATALERLTGEELIDARRAFQDYRDNMNNFIRIIENDRGTVVELAKTTSRLQEEMEKTGNEFLRIYQAYSGSQLNYENYMKLAAEAIQYDRKVQVEFYRDMTAVNKDEIEKFFENKIGILRDTHEQFKDSLTEVESSITKTVETSFNDATTTYRELLQKQNKEESARLEEQRKVVLGCFTEIQNSIRNSMGQVQEQAHELQRASSALVDAFAIQEKQSAKLTESHSQLLARSPLDFQEALRKVQDSANSTLEDSRKNLYQLYDKVSIAHEDALQRLLKLGTSQLREMSSSILEDWRVKNDTIAASIKSNLDELRVQMSQLQEMRTSLPTAEPIQIPREPGVSIGVTDGMMIRTSGIDHEIQTAQRIDYGDWRAKQKLEPAGNNPETSLEVKQEHLVVSASAEGLSSPDPAVASSEGGAT